MANENTNTGIEEIFEEIEDRDEDQGFEDEPGAGLDVEEAESALAGLRQAIIAIPKSEVRPLKAATTSAVGIGLAYARAYAEDRALFERTFTIEAFDPLGYDDLADRAKAFWRADIAMRQELSTEGPVRLLLMEAKPLRLKLMKAATYLWGDDPELSDVVAHIRKGNGYANKADDLGRLASLFAERWSEVEGKCDVNEEDIARAEALGAEILQAMSPSRVEMLDDARGLRNRAAEHLRRGIEDVRDAASYVFRKKPEEMERYPSLFTRSRRKVSNGKPSDAGSSGHAAPTRDRSLTEIGESPVDVALPEMEPGSIAANG